MPKPTAATPQWDTNRTNVTTVTGGHQTDGYGNSEIPTSGEWNDLLNRSGQHVNWLSGLWDSSGNLTLETNSNINVSGVGKYKRGTRVRHFPVITGRQVAGTAMTFDPNHDAVLTTATNNDFRVTIVVDEGERITNVKCRVQDTSGSDSVKMEIWRNDFSGTGPTRTSLGSATSTGSAGVFETLDTGALTETVGTQFYQYWCQFTAPTFNTGCTITGLYVTTDVP